MDMKLPKTESKKDTATVLLAGTTGFVIDSFLFAGTGLPPGTTGALYATGALGLKKLYDSYKPTEDEKKLADVDKKCIDLARQNNKFINKCFDDTINNALEKHLRKKIEYIEFYANGSQLKYESLLKVNNLLKLLCKLSFYTEKRKHTQNFLKPIDDYCELFCNEIIDIDEFIKHILDELETITSLEETY